MITKEETSFIYEVPGIDNVADSDREALLNEVGEYLLDSILDYVGEAKSPVAGGKYKAELSEKYADSKKMGDRLANLDLAGDMLQSLLFNIDVENGSISIGIFDKEQAIKSYNHNKGDTLPQRQFIPDEDQGLKAEIIRGVMRILQEYTDNG